jgi:hypothetical protein
LAATSLHSNPELIRLSELEIKYTLALRFGGANPSRILMLLIGAAGYVIHFRAEPPNDHTHGRDNWPRKQARKDSNDLDQLPAAIPLERM